MSSPLLGQSLSQLTQWVEQQGQPAYRGQQIYQWIYQRGARSLGEITVLPQQWRSTLDSVAIGRSSVHHRSQATDQTVKYLLRLQDGQIIETVGIPTAKRLTVCVSSQVGCPMGCLFCATGQGGLQRNLECHEIVDQVLTVQEDFGQRVSNVVFMGMGEPLLNRDAVLEAIRVLNQEVGIGQRSITLSTVGIPGQIRRLGETGQVGDRPLQFTLAVSLHASNQSVRHSLIPSAQAYPLEALLEECRDYVRLTHRRVTFEYILLARVNDRPEHAQELAQCLRGFQSHVNLIPYNPISEADYQRPDRHRIEAFSQILQKHRIAVSVRYSRGLDADAACGQLRATVAGAGA
ncbi:23S rRNA (adenine(2503)-C(2))-methyltransferase RlmN [Prochlorothrix hollandica]|uniref:23S rRNA (adenine(2503)-C(2))-methyltransferase RlmN n=1 Tax=Prochlorothrix hollandica TaxID=1223 RepID=UPI0033429BF4